MTNQMTRADLVHCQDNSTGCHAPNVCNCDCLSCGFVRNSEEKNDDDL